MTAEHLNLILSSRDPPRKPTNQIVFSKTWTEVNPFASRVEIALLLSINITGPKIPNKNKFGDYWTISISGQKFLGIFQNEIGFLINKKNNSLKNIIKENYNTNVDLIPAGRWIKKIRENLSLFQEDIAKFCKICIFYNSF